jgi:hypothetical protein
VPSGSGPATLKRLHAKKTPPTWALVGTCLGKPLVGPTESRRQPCHDEEREALAGVEIAREGRTPTVSAETKRK